MTVKMRIIEAKQKRGNVSRWQPVYAQLLSLPVGKTLEVNLGSYAEAEKLKNAMYTYAKRHAFKVSVCYGMASKTSTTLYIERLGGDGNS